MITYDIGMSATRYLVCVCIYIPADVESDTLRNILKCKRISDTFQNRFTNQPIGEKTEHLTLRLAVLIILGA